MGWDGVWQTQEFLVLGSQPLTALRDRLYCLTDELAQEAKLNVPSGYFLIEVISCALTFSFYSLCYVLLSECGGCGLEKLLCSGWSMHNWIEKIVQFLEVLKFISWICLQDVFYNDMRNPKAVDYSEPIIKWTRETKEATERWKAVGGAAGGRKSFGTTNQNSDSVSLPSFRWYSLVFSVCPVSFDAVQEGSQDCTDLGSAICLHIGPMKDAKYGDHVSLD